MSEREGCYRHSRRATCWRPDKMTCPFRFRTRTTAMPKPTDKHRASPMFFASAIARPPLASLAPLRGRNRPRELSEASGLKTVGRNSPQQAGARRADRNRRATASGAGVAGEREGDQDRIEFTHTSGRSSRPRD